nr:PREDICTED: octopamine receptor 2-like isoform X1 [Lepisosteus oculatus]
MDIPTKWPSSESLDYNGDPFIAGGFRAVNFSSSEVRLNISARTRLLLEVLIVLMALGAVAGNILVIVIVAATKTFHSVTSVLIINLAISDFLVGIGVMPFVAISVMYDGWVDCTDLCLYVGYTSSVYCTASVLTLAAIALDRYYAIIDCLHYSSQSTVWRTVAAVIWIWLQAAVTSCPPLLGWSHLDYIAPMYSCAVDWSRSPSYTGFVAAFSFMLPACIMVFCYVKIVKVARGHARRIHDLEDHLQRNRPHPAEQEEKPTFSRLIYCISGKILPETHRDETLSSPYPSCSSSSTGRLHNLLTRHGFHSKEHHGVFRLFLVIFAFFCCWMPYIIVALVQAIETATSHQSTHIPNNVITFAYWLALLNSDINPLLYALLSKRFQKALKSLRHKLHARVSQQVCNPQTCTEHSPQCPRNTAASSINSVCPERAFNSSLFSLDSCTPEGYKKEQVSRRNNLLPGHLSSAVKLERTKECVCVKPEGQGLDTQHLQVPSAPVESDKPSRPSSPSDRQVTFFYAFQTLPLTSQKISSTVLFKQVGVFLNIKITCERWCKEHIILDR